MNKKAIFYLTVCSFSYAIFLVINKYLLNLDYSAFQVIVSIGIVTTILSAIYFFHKFSEVKTISKRNWAKLFLIAILATFVAKILFYSGQALTSATNAGFLIKLSIFSTILFSYFMINEKLGKRAYTALIIMFGGAFLLTTGGTLEQVNSGDLFIIIVAAILGYTNILAKQVLKNVSAYIVSSLRFVIGNTLLLLSLIILFGFSMFNPLIEQPLWSGIGGILAIIYLFTFYRGVDLVGPSKTTIFFLLSSVFTAIFAFVFLEEALSAIQLLGGILILVGAYIISKR